MASKRRLRRKKCGSKQRFETKEKAIAAAKSAEWAFGLNKSLWAYPCPFCGGYHYGHKPRKYQGAPNALLNALPK